MKYHDSKPKQGDVLYQKVLASNTGLPRRCHVMDIK
jgi:hypothetical protein